MTTKTYRLDDLEGESWLISPGDPAHPLLDRLDKLSWEPRLPASVLAVGLVTESGVIDAEANLQILLGVRNSAQPDELQFLAPVLLDAHRTLRQLRYLKEGGGV